MSGKSLETLVLEVSAKYNADIYLFSNDVTDFHADILIDKIKETKTSLENCVLILTTYGGDPDAGYRIVRFIKRKYKKLVLFVFGSCKSTGTLMALGADLIVMSDYGEFGPLDIQLTKDDELTHTSGLSYLQSLIALSDRLYTNFEQSFLRLKEKSDFTISTKTAAEIASKLAIGLISPISGQIDPLKLGEVHRAIKIADDYGRRLIKVKNNNKAINLLLEKLIGNYSSHGFVIDIEEAKALFNGLIEIQASERLEEELEESLIEYVRRPHSELSIFAVSDEMNKEVAKRVNGAEAPEGELGNVVVREQLDTEIVEIQPKQNEQENE